jgi:hypothetical protein
MDGDVLTITATEFKAKCLSLFDELEGRKIAKVVVTRRGRPVAEMVLPQQPVADIWGAHPGSARYAPGVDPTAPALDDDWEEHMGLADK